MTTKALVITSILATVVPLLRLSFGILGIIFGRQVDKRNPRLYQRLDEWQACTQIVIFVPLMILLAWLWPNMHVILHVTIAIIVSACAFFLLTILPLLPEWSCRTLANNYMSRGEYGAARKWLHRAYNASVTADSEEIVLTSIAWSERVLGSDRWADCLLERQQEFDLKLVESRLLLIIYYTEQFDSESREREIERIRNDPKSLKAVKHTKRFSELCQQMNITF